ncbi:MAG: ketoacyl-ACP synthase III [Gammaproteobacteria bacterium]|nr:ketoacyl-ACP synthase III [Gammaproteobacteria bacterium]
MIYSQITGTGSCLPDNCVTNKDLEKIVDTSDVWIRERTGIEQRYIAPKGVNTCDLAHGAAIHAMESAGVTTRDIDLIIVATTTADRVFPSTACLLQSRLDIHGCPAFDVQAVCTGFIYALDVADKFIRSGTSKCALIVGAETFSRILNWEDRTTCVLFGDGAGAVVLQANEEPGIYSSHLHADGDYVDYLHVPCGVSNNYQAIIDGTAYVEMKGSEVFKMAVRMMGAVVDEALEANDMVRSDIDWLIPHQANIRILSATAKKLDLPMERVVATVAQHGNTSAASIPLALDTAVRDGRVQPGQTLLLEGFGGGFTWGAVLLRF